MVFCCGATIRCSNSRLVWLVVQVAASPWLQVLTVALALTDQILDDE